jgi:hypothetical protein
VKPLSYEEYKEHMEKTTERVEKSKEHALPSLPIDPEAVTLEQGVLLELLEKKRNLQGKVALVPSGTMSRHVATMETLDPLFTQFIAWQQHFQPSGNKEAPTLQRHDYYLLMQTLQALSPQFVHFLAWRKLVDISNNINTAETVKVESINQMRQHVALGHVQAPQYPDISAEAVAFANMDGSRSQGIKRPRPESPGFAETESKRRKLSSKVR